MISSSVIRLCILAKDQTLYDYLKKSSASAATLPAELLYQEELDTGLSVVFFINHRGKYECAIMKKRFPAGYKVIGHSGTLDIENADTYLYSSFVYNKETYDICWGILIDDNVTEVFLDNTPCHIADTAYERFRIYWLMGLWEDVPRLTTASSG